MTEPGDGATYAGTGVDIAAGDLAVELMRPSVELATRPEVVGGLGGFAGLFDLTPFTRFRRPLLATSTDGVGTKIDVARRMDVHDTIGIDLVAMVLDDLVVCGAEPLFMTDYIATGQVRPERVAAIVAGIAEGCRRAGAALVGGETAEHPGLLDPDEYDVAGAGVGIVDADAVLGPEKVAVGDVVIAMGSSGLHSNGYSLARHVFFERAGWDVDRAVPELGRTLGEELLEPTRIYALDCLALAASPVTQLHAVAHVTGGGLAGNLVRVLPGGVRAVVDRATWSPAAVFGLIAELGSVSRPELEKALNCGVGMVAIVAPDGVPATLSVLGERGVPSWVCGTVEPTAGEPASVQLVGDHPG